MNPKLLLSAAAIAALTPFKKKKDEPAAEKPPEPKRPVHPFDLKESEHPGVPKVLFIGTANAEEIVSFKVRQPDGKPPLEMKATYTRRHYPQGYQDYFCPYCCTGTSNGILDEGVTPMVVKCQTPGCAHVAQSRGQHSEQHYDCREEWYYPGQIARDTIRRKDAGLFDHLSRGGLDRRPAAQYVCALCTRPIDRNKAHSMLKPAARRPEEAAKEPVCMGCANRHLPPKQRTGRNEPCPCGSGRKFKDCCAKPN